MSLTVLTAYAKRTGDAQSKDAGCWQLERENGPQAAGLAGREDPGGPGRGCAEADPGRALREAPIVAASSVASTSLPRQLHFHLPHRRTSRTHQIHARGRLLQKS